MTGERQERAGLLSSKDAAEALELEPATLRDWVRRGLLTNLGGPRRALYDPVELVAAMEAEKPRRRRDTPSLRRGA